MTDVFARGDWQLLAGGSWGASMHLVFSLSSFTFSGGPFDAPQQAWLSSPRGAEGLTGGHGSACSPALTSVINEECLGVIYVPFFMRLTTRGQQSN